MWLFSSSVGRKFVMALTGLCLVLFVTFHVLMNAVALIWPWAYNNVCEFLGANWYALIASAGLALLFIIHIVYACWLTLQNRAARGNDRYAVTSRPPQVEWSSKNMLVLGIVVLAFLVVHLIQFWAKMQWMELRDADLSVLPQLEGVPVAPAQGTLFLQMAFSNSWTIIVYIIGFVALWFHMTHGFWSMLHSIGWDNKTWLPRLKCIGNCWTTIVIALFIAQAVVFTVQAHRNYYLNNDRLQEQYAEYWEEKAGELNEQFLSGMQIAMEQAAATASEDNYMEKQMKAQQAQNEYIQEVGADYVKDATAIDNAYTTICPSVPAGAEVQKMKQFTQQLNQMLNPAGLHNMQQAQ